MSITTTLKYSDVVAGTSNPNVLLIKPAVNTPTRAVEYSVRFSYAEFWGVKDLSGTNNTNEVLYGYKTGEDQSGQPIYLLKRVIPIGEAVPLMVDNLMLHRDLSEFIFKTQSENDAILILYWL